MKPKKNGNHPSVSVIITCYNYGRFLKECIESVLTQTLQGLEVIVINDGSLDDTEDICRSFGGNIRYHAQPNRGLAEALNRGIEMSSGDFLYFLSADDKLFPETIERQLEAMEGDETCAVVCGNAKMIDEKGRFIGDNIIPFPEKKRLIRMLGTPNLHDGSLLFRKTSLEKINALYFDPGLGNYHIYHYKCFLLAKEFRICYLNRFLVYQRVHPFNLSHPKHLTKMIAGYEVLRKEMRKHVTVFDLFEGVDRGNSEEMAKAYYQLGALFFFFGQYEIAYEDLKKASAQAKDIFEKGVNLSELDFGQYIFPLPVKKIKFQDSKGWKAIECVKNPEVNEIIVSLERGNIIKAFFLCKEKLESEPKNSGAKYLLAKTYLRQLQFHDSVNRFHEITLGLLREVQTEAPLHSIDLYLWLGFLDEEKRDEYFSELLRGMGRMKFYDVKEMAWLTSNAKAMGKIDWLERGMDIFNQSELSLGALKEVGPFSMGRSTKSKKDGGKRVLFISPPYNRFLGLENARFPLSFGNMAPMLVQAGHEVGIYDADFDKALLGRRGTYQYTFSCQSKIQKALNDRNHPVWHEIEQKILDFHPDVVGLTAMTNKYPMAVRIAEIVKRVRPECRVVIGGQHASIFGNRLLEDRNIDLAVIGEGELTMGELIEQLTLSTPDFSSVKGLVYKDRKGVVATVPREFIEDLDSLPLPNRALMINEGYVSENNIITSRGCPFHCHYCGGNLIWKHRVRRRSVGNVMKEIHTLIERSGSKNISFWDDSFTCDKRYTAELMTALKTIPGLTFSCITRVDLVNKALLSQLKEAGCNNILFGIESGSDRILNLIHKGTTRTSISEKIDLVNSVGIPWLGFFIMGYPGETAEDILETLRFMKQLDPPYAEINIFNPLPGTPVWDDLEREGRVSPEMDFSRHSQASTENCYLEGMPPETFQNLALRVAGAFDEHNRRKQEGKQHLSGEKSLVPPPRHGNKAKAAVGPISLPGITHTFPKDVHFLMIDKCNSKCIFCGGDYFRSTSGRRITLDKFKQMDSNLRLQRFQTIVLSGAGDPLLNPDLIPIIYYVNRQYPNIRVVITTNGIALSTKLSEALLECSVSSINVSINAASPYVYKRVMQVDHFSQVCENAKTFLSLRNQMNRQTIFQFSSAISRLNVEDLPRLVELAHDLGVDSINLMYCRFYPERLRHLNIESNESRLLNQDSLFYHQGLSDQMVEKAKSLSQQYGIQFTHEALFREKAKASPCRWPETSIMVGFDGEVYPCGGAEVHFKEKVEGGGYDFGNVLKEPLETFWNGELYRKLRISCQMEGRGPIMECEVCANRINPNHVRSHIMHWEDPSTLPNSEHGGQPSEQIPVKVEESPLVSVIVPTYNRPEMLIEAVRSILNQTYAKVEIVVVNDAGVDVESVVTRLNNKGNITYVKHDRNRGLAAARNTGIRLARGKYIAYLDDDDLYYPEHLESLVHFINSSGCKIAYTDAYRAYQIKENGKYKVVRRDIPFSRDFDEKGILVSNFIPVLCVMHEKSCLDEVGFFDETLTTHEDWDLWIRLSRKFKFHHIPKATCEFSYRQDGTTMSSGNRADFLKTSKIIYQKHEGEVAGQHDLMAAQKQFLQNLENEIHRKIPPTCPAKKTASVSVIIPVYNQLPYTRRCLKAIQETTPASGYEVIVVDNGSTDGTTDFLRQEQEAGRLHAIFNKQNTGFAKACNQGAREAASEYLLFLNNDTEPKKGWLDSLVGIMENDSTVAGVGSKLLFPDGTIQHAGVVLVDHRKLNDPLRAEHIYLKASSDLPNANRLMSYQALTAACLLMRKEAFDEVKGFDEGYWNGYEDVDLCLKLREKGWKLVYQPQSVVIHFESQSGPERFAKVPNNISRLHQKWLGRVKPDLIIEKDGTVRETQTGGIQPYSMVKSPETLLQSADQPEEKVSIVILTFNQLKYTKKCVESIRQHTSGSHEIIFVDNGSKDGTVRWLRGLVNKNSNYRLIENGKNLGFATGCNQGIQAATGEYILLLNNDVVVTEGWLSGMLQCLKSNPDSGIVGPMTNSISGPQKVHDPDYGSTGRLEEYARSFREKNRGRRIPAKRIVGFCMLFKRELTKKIGLLDETFGSGNFEDDDFCLRAILEGYQNFIAGDVFIHHYGSRSFVGNRINYADALSRNRSIFQEKWRKVDTKGLLGLKLQAIQIMEKADELNQKDQVGQALEVLYNGIASLSNERRLYQMLAEMLIDNKQYQEALQVLDKMASSDADIWKWERVGYCQEGLDRHEDAEKIIDGVLSIHPNSSYAWNLKGMVAYKKGDKEGAERLFQKAMALDPGYGEPCTNLGVLKWAGGQKEEAVALLEKGFILSPTVTDGITLYHQAITAIQGFERAERTFREAKILYPSNRRIAFLLIDLLVQQGKREAAMSEIEEAMVHFGIDDGILSAALEIRGQLGMKEIEARTKGTVSLCMIVRNEEENLARSLMSIKSVMDEMIVIDTGSQDRTKEIARAFGAQVFDYEWTEDFSEARNFSLSKAKGEWIFILDADEVISPIDHGPLIRMIKERPPHPVAYSFTTRNYVDPVNVSGWTANDGRYPEEAGTGWFPGGKVRLFPNAPRICFEHPVHELAEPSLRRAGIKIKECAVPVHHYGKLMLDKNEKKGEGYFLLGMKKLEERGDDFTSLYELAIQAGELGRYAEAAELWQRCLRLQPKHPKAHFNLGYVCLKLGKYEDALAASARAMELDPHFKEAAFNYSLCEFCAGDIRQAILVLEGLVAREPQYPSAIGLLSAAYILEGKKEKGLETLSRIKKMGYDGPAILHSFADRLVSAGRRDAAVLLLERAIETQNMSEPIVTLLAQCKTPSPFLSPQRDCVVISRSPFDTLRSPRLETETNG